jgi:molecular chaperone GrpE (heat shock protein)
MINRLKQWLGRSAATDERVLALEREAQALRLELAERERARASLDAALTRQREGENSRAAALIQARLERLFGGVATPAAQLLTQAYWLEVEAKPIQAKDVLAVAKRLVRALEEEGLCCEGTVGATVAFDPDRHESLAGPSALTAGQPAVVRFPGVSLQGKVLRKAGVEALASP